MVRQVPTWMLEDDRYRRIVEVFEALGSIHLEHADQLEHVFDASVAPPAMVRLMGRWIGVDLIDPALPELLQREIVREMGRLARWRGTRSRVAGRPRAVTREPVEVVDPAATFEEGSERPAPGGCVVIHVQSTGWIDEDHFVELVRREVPANVPFELWLGDRRLWPPPPEEGRARRRAPSCAPVRADRRRGPGPHGCGRVLRGVRLPTVLGGRPTAGGGSGRWSRHAVTASGVTPRRADPRCAGARRRAARRAAAGRGRAPTAAAGCRRCAR